LIIPFIIILNSIIFSQKKPGNKIIHDSFPGGKLLL